jgi:hypothetical protein
LPANVSKEKSWDFVRVGATSEFGSFVLAVAEAAAVAAVPGTVTAGVVVAVVVEPGTLEAVVPAAVGELLLPPR